LHVRKWNPATYDYARIRLMPMPDIGFRKSDIDVSLSNIWSRVFQYLSSCSLTRSSDLSRQKSEEETRAVFEIYLIEIRIFVDWIPQSALAAVLGFPVIGRSCRIAYQCGVPWQGRKHYSL
jgi:hypothetical protein